MSSLFYLSITTAALCGTWVYLANITGLLAWAGFAGCTAFFAAGGIKSGGLKTALITNLSGAFWGMVIIAVSSFIVFPQSGTIITAVITFILCMQSKNKYLAFIPGSFIGCFSTLAAKGNYRILIPSLMLGAFLGLLCEYTGTKMYELMGKKA